MQQTHLNLLRCPICHRPLYVSEVLVADDELRDGTITCKKEHIWRVNQGIPSVLHPPIADSDIKQLMEQKQQLESCGDLLVKYSELLGMKITWDLLGLTAFLQPEGPWRILDAAVGGGYGLIALGSVLRNKISLCELHGLDMSMDLLTVAQHQAIGYRLPLRLTLGSFFNMPYNDNTFDLVFCVGRIGALSQAVQFMREMHRVIKSGGFAVVIGESFSPAMRRSEWGIKILESNPVFNTRPPLQFIPDQARNVEVRHVLDGTFYQLCFTK